MMKLNIQLFAAKTKKTTFSESNINVTENTSDLKITIEFSSTSSETWFSSKSLSCTCNGKTQSANVSLSQGGTVKKTFTFKGIKHNNDGSKTVAWSWNIATGTSGLGNLSDSGNKTLTKISRASTFYSFGWGQNAEDGISFNIEKYLSNVYHTLIVKININNTDYTIATRDDEDLQLDVGITYCDLELSSNEANTLYNLLPTSNNCDLIVELYTYTDYEKTLQLGSKDSCTAKDLKLNCAPPTFSDINISDVNQTTVDLTGDSSKIIARYSNLNIDIPSSIKAIANDGATMQYYNIDGTNYPYSENFSQTLNNFINSSVSVFAIDSRGKSTNVIKPITLINYSNIVKTSNTCSRANNTGSQVTFNIEGKYWNGDFGNVVNSLTATYKYQKTDTQTPDVWTTGITSISLTTNNDTFTFSGVLRGDSSDNGWELEDAYNVIITVSDELSSVDFVFLINAASPAIAIQKNNVSVGGDYDSTRGGRLQLLGKMVIDLEYVGEYNDGS